MHAAARELADQQPGLRAVEQPAQRGPGQRPGHPGPAHRLLQRRPPRGPEHQVQDGLGHLGIQAGRGQRGEGQHPPVVPRRVRRDQRQHHARRDQPDHQRDGHGHQAGRAAAPARDAVVAGQLDLRGHRPHRSRHVLGHLPDEHDPDRGRQRQRRAQVGQQRPPGQHHAAQPGQRAAERPGHLPAGQLVQRGAHRVPLRGQPPHGQPGRGGQARPAARPAARGCSAVRVRRRSGTPLAYPRPPGPAAHAPGRISPKVGDPATRRRG